MDQEEIVDAIRDWLDEDGWRYEYDAERHLIKMGINLKSKIKSGRIYVDVKEDCYVVYLVSPISGSVNNLGELIKYVTMANHGLMSGNFEVDMEDGEIRYTTYVDCEGLKALSTDVVRNSICIPCCMMDRYGNGLAALAMEFSDAETEIKKAEAPSDSAQDEQAD